MIVAFTRLVLLFSEGPQLQGLLETKEESWTDSNLGVKPLQQRSLLPAVTV